MDITFNSLEELYQRIKPALLTKKEEMRRNGYVYIRTRYLELFKRSKMGKFKKFIFIWYDSRYFKYRWCHNWFIFKRKIKF